MEQYKEQWKMLGDFNMECLAGRTGESKIKLKDEITRRQLQQVNKYENNCHIRFAQ